MKEKKDNKIVKVKKEKKETIKEVGMTHLPNMGVAFYVSEIGESECLFANPDLLLVYQYFGETTATVDLNRIKFMDAKTKSLFERLNKIIDKSNEYLDALEVKFLKG